MYRLVLIALFILFSAAYAEEEAKPADQCCFAREGYQGICKVTPGEGETCASILEYLNAPGTVGKSYCGGSKLRGGWEAVECEAEPSSDEEDR